MHNARRAPRRLLSAILLSVAALLVAVFVGRGAGVAHAMATPTTPNAGGGGDNSGYDYQFSAALSSFTTTGYHIAVEVMIGGGNSYTVDNVSDSTGDTFTRIAAKQDGLNDDVELWDATEATNNYHEHVTVNFTNGTCHGGGSPSCTSYIQWKVNLLEVAGSSGPESTVCTGANNNSSTTTHTCNSASLGTSDDELDLGVYADGGANTALSLPSGESLEATQDSTVNMEWAFGSADAQSSFEFDSASGVPYAAYLAVAYASS